MIKLRFGKKLIGEDIFSMEGMVVATFVIPILLNYLTEISMAYGLPSLIPLSYAIIFIIFTFIIGKSLLLNPLRSLFVYLVGLITLFCSCIISPGIVPYIFTPNSEGYYGILTSNFMMYFTRCLIMISAFVVGIDVRKLTECLVKWSGYIVLAYIVLNFVNFSKVGHSTQYMNNAYGALIPVALLYDKGMSEKRWLTILLSLVAGVFLLISGSRGAAITLISFLLLYHIIDGKFTPRKILIILLTITITVIFVYNLDHIFSWIVQLFGRFGISTRLSDLIMGSESGVYKSESRLSIYETARKDIGVIGGGLFYDRCITNYEYAHNFILEFLLDFGLLLGIPVLMIMGYRIFKFVIMVHNIEKIKVWVPIVLASLLVHYMLTASFLIAQDFWLMIGIVFTMTSSKYSMGEIKNKYR